MGKKVLTGDNDLATTIPLLALEWDVILNGDKTPHNVIQGSRYKAHWICPINREHKYQAAVSTRSRGSGCPHCVTYRNESEFCQLFTGATNFTFTNGHITSKRERFKRDRIQVDMISFDHNVIIEYDGYWTHGPNKLHKKTGEEREHNDIDTTTSIIKAGYKIIRIRETPLKFMSMKDENLYQVHYKDKEDKMGVVEKCVKALQKMGVGIEVVTDVNGSMKK